MNNGHASSEASSSSHSPQEQPHAPNHHRPNEDSSANDHDPARYGADDDIDLLGEDPLHGDLNEPISFKRKQKRPSIFSFAQQSKLFTNFTGSRRESSAGHNRPDTASTDDVPRNGAGNTDYIGASPPRRRMGSIFPGSKDGMPLDWYAEGPGRRVGYEDLTAIDWIFEYTKERTRLRVLKSNSRGILGYFQMAFDNSQEWIILLSTGIMVGTVAAVIDIVTDWLGDLKTGYCTTAEGGAFYLNKAFCCLGYDEGAQCMGWRPWAAGISSAAGRWIIEYFFFIMFSVRFPLSTHAERNTFGPNSNNK